MSCFWFLDLSLLVGVLFLSFCFLFVFLESDGYVLPISLMWYTDVFPESACSVGDRDTGMSWEKESQRRRSLSIGYWVREKKVCFYTPRNETGRTGSQEQ